MKTLKINHDRLIHLIKMYGLNQEELYKQASKKLKKPLTEADVFSEEIKLNHLKRIDQVFNEGLPYYINPETPIKKSSVFFRKKKFASQLTFEDRKIINKFEKKKIQFSAIAKLSELDVERKLSKYNLKQNPEKIAFEIKKELYPKFNKDSRKFLTNFINRLSEFNILVFEHIVHHGKKEKPTIEGCFIRPNTIIIKRQKSYRREIFTLAHELGHYLLNEEEVEQLAYGKNIKGDLQKIESWCNEFAFHFLLGEDNLKKIKEMRRIDSELIKSIVTKHVSQLAIYTHLLYRRKINRQQYNKYSKEIEQKQKEWEEKEKKDFERQREENKRNGKKIFISSPKPIKSDLLVETVQAAFYSNVLEEHEVVKYLGIKGKEIGKYI